MKGFVLFRVFAAAAVCAAVLIGAGLGLSLAMTVNVRNEENFVDFAPALPTKVLDIHGNLITEFSADEKRELVSLADLPRHLIHAALAREDPDFYNHRGFSLRGIARAVYGQVTGQTLGGGSTITQQVAGTLYTDRTEKTIWRKIRELWWAIQMERRYTKNEILEIYLNYMYMGPGVYGVEAASKYFFGHSAREISLAEAAILVVQLSNPSRFNPLDHPNVAMERQRWTLNRMVELGYATADEADQSFNEYWDSYDYTRASTSAYYSRADGAPWFSEYVRRELDTLMYGTMDYYRDGYTVLTTLDLGYQQAAEKYMAQGLARANREYTRAQGARLVQAERVYIPIVDLLSLTFNLNAIHATSDAQNEQKARARFTKVINPVADMAALVFGMPDLKILTNAGSQDLASTAARNMIEGALITIENETGYIKAVVGGSRYSESNQYIRAIQGRVMPGSSFKPLYYSAAIDLGKFHPASLIYDLPMVFHNEDGTPYIPLNFRGEWKGSVLLADALAQSMNVASLKVLDAIGFDAAIDRAALLLGIDDPEVKRRTFPRVYPMGLGIISVSPIQMARAFAVFANQGREVTPIAIRSVEDRNGRVVLDVERDMRLAQRRRGNNAQVISPQNAYVMTMMMKRTVEAGTMNYGTAGGGKLAYQDERGNRYRIPSAGKTGTTQNWSDAWTVGFTPYYTTAIWYGFDQPGNSLGLTNTGAVLAGPVWGDYMREIHTGHPMRDFVRPNSGVTDLSVCSQTGMLKTAACPRGITMTFLEGNQPALYCDAHQGSPGVLARSEMPLGTMRRDTLGIDERALLSDLAMPVLDLDLLPPSREPERAAPRPGSSRQRDPRSTTRTAPRPNSRTLPPAGQGRNAPGLTPPGTARLFPDEDEDDFPQGYPEDVDGVDLWDGDAGGDGPEPGGEPFAGPEMPDYNPYID